MRYSEYGLDDNKKAMDEGTVGSFHCPWCQKDVANGLSMCFSNMCICQDCMEAADYFFARHSWKPDDGNGCFKCCKGKIKKQFEKLYYDKTGTLSICADCIQWGLDVLNNKEKYKQEASIKQENMIQDILKQCTVEGLVVKLPPDQLDRKVYEQVKKSLELIGGKWKGGKVSGFVFEQDPTELLAAISEGEDRNIKKEYQFFPTPEKVAIMMMERLPVPKSDRELVLEPSAGDGALIYAFRNYTGSDIKVDCFELMEINRLMLSKIDGVNIIGDDFLKCDLVDHYDTVIANPPFTNNQDIDHILKIYQVCKPGVTIVTLSSPSWQFQSNKKQVSFKKWLEILEADVEEIEAGEFKKSGTNIKTLMITITKPEKDPEGLPATLSQMNRKKEGATKGTPFDEHLPAPESFTLVSEALQEGAKDFVKARHDEQSRDIHDSNVVVEERIKEMNETLTVPTGEMNFFRQLAAMGNTDLTIRIMQKNDKLTMNIQPGPFSVMITPMNITGTGDDLDAEFFKTIMPGVKEVTALVSNIEEVKEELEQEAAEKPVEKAAAKQINKRTIPEKKAPSKQLKQAEPLF